jgi:hypothetical protein
MQLPAGFPHTRHEQYLVALPDQLLSDDESPTVIAILKRFREFCDALLVRVVLKGLPPEPSEEDFVLGMAAAFSRRGPLFPR